MPWGPLLLAIFAVYVLQTAVLWTFGLAWFDPFLALTLLFGLLWAAPEARLAGWITGLAQDLGSQDALGIHAVTLGLTALLATQLRRFLNPNVWWARFLILFLAAWPPQVVYFAHLHYWSGAGVLPISALIRQSGWLSLATVLVALLALALPWVTAWRRRRRRGGARAY